MTKFTKIRNAFTAGVLAIVLSLSLAPAANAATSGDPLNTGCANSAFSYKTVRPEATTIELRYSNGCGTNWLRASGVGGRTFEMGIYSPNSGWKWTPSYGSAPSGQIWTPMVHAPGSTCVQATVRIVPWGSINAKTYNYLWC